MRLTARSERGTRMRTQAWRKVPFEIGSHFPLRKVPPLVRGLSLVRFPRFLLRKGNEETNGRASGWRGIRESHSQSGLGVERGGRLGRGRAALIGEGSWVVRRSAWKSGARTHGRVNGWNASGRLALLRAGPACPPSFPSFPFLIKKRWKRREAAQGRGWREGLCRRIGGSRA